MSNDNSCDHIVLEIKKFDLKKNHFLKLNKTQAAILLLLSYKKY